MTDIKEIERERNGEDLSNIFIKLPEKDIVSELLKRISNLEFEVERYENILDTLEKHLLKTYKENMDTASEKCWTIANQSMYIYNYIQKLKEIKNDTSNK